LLRYHVNVTHQRLAVFSEMHYPKGWNAYLNDKLIDYHKVNYLLRGVVLPPGSHQLTFKFEPAVIRTGTFVMASGWLIFALAIGLFLPKNDTH
jgi:uncharacterized membrane protein YfhO